MIKLMQRWLDRRGLVDNAQPSVEMTTFEGVNASMPPGRRLYCIGDIHGRLDLLEELHALILKDGAAFEGSKVVVYLGDYIDRGEHSKQVLDLLIEQPLEQFESVHLLGNHEQAMLDFLRNPEGIGTAWLSFGGQVTCMSYGVGIDKAAMDMDLELLKQELVEKLPGDHLDFLNSLLLYHIEGDYCFVHAGIKPGVPIEDQEMGDLLWIRDEFIQSDSRHDFVVVHGHTISEEVEALPNRIGIDTGAYQSGLLTALVLEGSEQRLLQTGRNG